MLLLLLLWVNLLSCRRLTSSPVKSGIADGGASARPVTAGDPSQLGEPELPLTMQEAGVDWLDFEDDVPILIEMVKQSPHFEAYQLNLVMHELSPEEAADFVFGDPEGDPLADLENFAQWVAKTTNQLWNPPCSVIRRALQRKAGPPGASHS